MYDYCSIGIMSCGVMTPETMPFIFSVLRELDPIDGGTDFVIGSWLLGRLPTPHSVARFASVTRRGERAVIQLLGIPSLPLSSASHFPRSTLTTMLMLKGVLFVRNKISTPEENEWYERLQSLLPVFCIDQDMLRSPHGPNAVSQWILKISLQTPKTKPKEDDDDDRFAFRVVTRRGERYIGFVVSGAHDPTTRSGDAKITALSYNWSWGIDRIVIGNERTNVKGSLYPGQSLSIVCENFKRKCPIPILFHESDWLKFNTSQWIKFTLPENVAVRTNPGDTIRYATELSCGTVVIHASSSNTAIAYSTVPVPFRHNRPEEHAIASLYTHGTSASWTIIRCSVSLCSLAHIPINSTPKSNDPKDRLLRVVLFHPAAPSPSGSHTMLQVRADLARRRHRFEIIEMTNVEELHTLDWKQQTSCCIVLWHNNTPQTKDVIDKVMSWRKSGASRNHVSFAILCEGVSMKRTPESKLLRRIGQLKIGGVHFIEETKDTLSEFATFMTANRSGIKTEFRGWIPLNDRAGQSHALVCGEALLALGSFKRVFRTSLHIFLGYQLLLSRIISPENVTSHKAVYPVKSPVPESWTYQASASILEPLGLFHDPIEDDDALTLMCLYVTNPDMVAAVLTLSMNHVNLIIPQDHWSPTSVFMLMCEYGLHMPVVRNTVIKDNHRYVLLPPSTVVTTFPNFSGNFMPLQYHAMLQRLPVINVDNSNAVATWIRESRASKAFVVDHEKRELNYTWKEHDRPVCAQPLRALYVDAALGVYVFDIPSSIPHSSHTRTHLNNVRAMLSHLHLPDWNFEELHPPSG
eukprot:PhF_6_TR1035/c0_g1_i2/m.2104